MKKRTPQEDQFVNTWECIVSNEFCCVAFGLVWFFLLTNQIICRLVRRSTFDGLKNFVRQWKSTTPHLCFFFSVSVKIYEGVLYGTTNCPMCNHAPPPPTCSSTFHPLLYFVYSMILISVWLVQENPPIECSS